MFISFDWMNEGADIKTCQMHEYIQFYFISQQGTVIMSLTLEQTMKLKQLLSRYSKDKEESTHPVRDVVPSVEA